jgi:tRNA1(Val) A37 N6-methylase TrmN6
MIHRAQRTAEIIDAMKEASFTPKRIQFVHSSAEGNAPYVMIEAYRHGGDFAAVLAPIVIYDANGAYSAQINKIYGRSGT